MGKQKRADLINIYNRDRNKAVMSLDVERFKTFCRKWGNPIPPTDEIIEITMRKMACHIPSLPDEFRAEAKKWLDEKGYTDSLK